VQSLTAAGMEGTAASLRAGGRRAPFAGIVLPKVLRRPVRMLEKAEVRLPRFLGIKSVSIMFLATVVAGVALGGHSTTVAAAVTTWAGFGIEQVKITGQSRTEELAVLEKLEIGAFPSLVTFDLDAAKARIETLPWVAEAGLQKLYPHDLTVSIRERRPYAFWQDGERLWLIDETGHAITGAAEVSPAMPMVVGKGAAGRIADYTGLLAAVPSIARQIHAGVLVAGRRWTLVLANGIEVLLPEHDPAPALAALARLDAENAVLSRAIAAVDLRDPQRVVLRLAADGAASWTALLKARAKAAKDRA
jgi:cell division protein FtsQ